MFTFALMETCHDRFGIGQGTQFFVWNGFSSTPIQAATGDAPFRATSTVIRTIYSSTNLHLVVVLEMNVTLNINSLSIGSLSIAKWATYQQRTS